MTQIREYPFATRTAATAHSAPIRGRTIAAGTEASVLLRKTSAFALRKAKNGFKARFYALSDSTRHAYLDAAERLSDRLGQGLKIGGRLERVRLFEVLLHQDTTLAMALVRAERAERELAAVKEALRQLQVAPRAEVAPENQLADALAAARARGDAYKAQLENDPDLLSTAQVAGRLGMTQEGVRQKLKRHELLGLVFPRRGLRYPSWQFLPDGRLLPALPRLFAILGDDDWGMYGFLRQHHAEVDGARAVDALRRGDIAGVIAAAENMASGAFS